MTAVYSVPRMKRDTMNRHFDTPKKIQTLWRKGFYYGGETGSAREAMGQCLMRAANVLRGMKGAQHQLRLALERYRDRRAKEEST